MKKWIVILIVALGLVGIVYEIWSNNSPVNLSTYTTLDTTVVDTNPWKPLISISEADTDMVYEVVWDQKYGSTKTAYCLAVFRNEQSKQYKLIAPWLNSVIIEYQNTNNIKFNRVLKKDATGYSDW